MGDDSEIAWTDATFNPWEGCAKVSPGCAHCYAEARNVRFHGGDHWGASAPRLKRAEAYWRNPRKWNARAAAEGVRRRVFCASLADVFEDHPDVVSDRIRLFSLIEECTALDWLLLTKRPENLLSMLPHAWISQPRRHVILGTTAEDQYYADERIPKLLATPSWRWFVSVEPQLGPVDLQRYLERCHASRDGECSAATCPQLRDGEPHRSGRHCPLDDWNKTAEWVEEWMLPPRLSWVICGGESEERAGPRARGFDIGWARTIRADCEAAKVPCFIKQLGSRPYYLDQQGGMCRLGGITHPKGQDMSEWPEDLRIREFPHEPTER